MLKLSETIDDMVAYTRVNDSVLLNILNSIEPQLDRARQILENIERRRLYRFIGQTNPKSGREDVMVLPVVFLHCIHGCWLPFMLICLPGCLLVLLYVFSIMFLLCLSYHDYAFMINE